MSTTKIMHRSASFTDPDLRSDNDEEPAFKMRETEQVVALPLSSRCSRLTRPLMICLMLAMIVLGYLNWTRITAGIELVIQFWITNPFYGFILFLGVHLICAVGKMPMVQLILAAGYVNVQTFGVGIGILIGCCESMVASLISSSVEYAIGQYFCQRRVKTWVEQSRKLEAVATLLQTNGFKVVVMIRLAMVVPFGTANYLLAAMNVSFKNFLLGSVGLLPYIITCTLAGASSSIALIVVSDVSLGGSISSIVDVVNGRSGNPLTTVIVISASAVLTLAISIYITIWTRRALGKLELQERRRSVTVRRNSQIQLMLLSKMQKETPTATATESGETTNLRYELMVPKSNQKKSVMIIMLIHDSVLANCTDTRCSDNGLNSSMASMQSDKVVVSDSVRWMVAILSIIGCLIIVLGRAIQIWCHQRAAARDLFLNDGIDVQDQGPDRLAAPSPSHRPVLRKMLSPDGLYQVDHIDGTG